MKNLILFLPLLLLISGCNNHAMPKMEKAEQPSPADARETVQPQIPGEFYPGANAVYHWKTTFNPSEKDLEFMKKHDVKRIFLRFFDVTYDCWGLGERPRIIPAGTTRFKQEIPGGTEVVPTVFITVEAMKQMEEKIPEYVDTVLTRIKAMAKRNRVGKVHEIQLDCDWTPSTEELYFSFCRNMKKLLAADSISLTSTIRLHQLKGKVPPVDRGTLMLYNTGMIRNAGTENSILSYNDVKAYLKVDGYPLPLDFAYPTFEWGIWFKDGKFECILHKSDFSDSTCYKPIGKNRYRVIKNHYVENHKLFEGDMIRCETSPCDEILKVKNLAEKKLKTGGASVILYHLDSDNLSKFTDDEINKIYRN